MKNVRISSARVIAYVVRKFGLTDDGWVPDCVESIGHALGTLNLGLDVEKTYVSREVINHKCYPPCNAEFINGVYCGAVRIPKLNSSSNRPELNVQGATPKPAYWFNGPYIQFTFETGTVEVHYHRFHCDDRGFPMIPNSDKLVEALAWHFLSEYLAAGNTHPVFDFSYADAKWEQFQTRAFNDVNFPDVDDAERFNKMFTSMVPNIDLHEFSFVEYQNPDDEGDISQFTGTTISN